MTLSTLSLQDFRCFAEASLDFDEASNLIVGANAAGKTSLLEAIAYLGRGRSFRGATALQVVRHGAKEFVLQGRLALDRGERVVGVRNGGGGLEIRLDRERQASVAALAEALPLQVVDPEIHELVGGGPERRRRYLDWMLFHVEHDYLRGWQRFRRVLKQRNAALKRAESGSLDSWDREFAEAGDALSASRQRALERAREALERTAGVLLAVEAGFEYRRGWPEGMSLGDALRENRDRDLALGATQQGPQRADIRLKLDDRAAKRLVSRGQQKLLACSMVLAGVEVVQASLGRRLLVLLDDPAAELDADSLSRLLGVVDGLGCQVIATALRAEGVLLEGPRRLFHVEHGRVLAVETTP